MDESALLAGARGGDREALGRLLMLNQRPCYAFALRLTRNPADAEDVCQDAFLRATRDMAGYGGLSSFRSWLFSLVVHAYGDRTDSEQARRRREKEKAMESNQASGAEPAESENVELRTRLDAALGRLRDSYRLPIIMHFENGFSHSEVAAALAVPEGTVKTNIKRGLEELKNLMTAAGYTCTVPAITGALAQGLAVSVPAGLTTFIQGLTATAGSGAAAVGKAAASISARISSRLAAKKAAGLALGWKVGTVVTAAAIGGAAVVAVSGGMFREQPATPPATITQDTGLVRGLAGWWRFDEGSGNVAHDSSGNGNHGRIAGAEWTEGRYGRGLQVNGKSQRVEVPWSASLAATRGATIAAWVRMPDRPGAGDKGTFLHIGQMIEGSSNYRLSLAKEHTFKLGHSWESRGLHTTTADCGTWPEGWFHVAFTVTAEGGRSYAVADSYAAYVNGRLLASSQLEPQHVLRFTRLVPLPGEPLMIGGVYNGFPAAVDEVRVYTRALNAEEVGRLAGEREPPG